MRMTRWQQHNCTDVTEIHSHCINNAVLVQRQFNCLEKYIYFNYTEVTSLDVIQIFYCMPHLVFTTLYSSERKCKEFQKYQKKITWHHHCAFHKNLAIWLLFVRVHFYVFHFTVLNQSLQFCIDTITQNLITFCKCKV